MPWEIGNAFSAMLKRKRIELDAVQRAIVAYEQLPIRLVEVGLTQSLTLSAQLGIYAYDAYMIACAQVERCSLLSLDGGLVHAAKRAGVPILEVAQ